MMRSLRIATHVHSAWSYDAAWSLPAIAAAFARRRYDAVLMCEHDVGFSDQRWQDYRKACAEASEQILLVPGIEYGDPDNVVHLPVWGDVPFLGSGRSGAQLLRAAAAEGGVAVFAHPWRREAWRRFDPAWVEHLAAVEVWNRKYDGWAPSAGACRLAQEHGLAPMASLDFHTRRQLFPLATRLLVTEAAEAEVVAALAAGRGDPEAFGTSALRFTRGTLGAVAQQAERLRAPAARTARRLLGR